MKLSNYTMQLRHVCESVNNYSEDESLFDGFNSMEDNIRLSRQKIFSFSYSFYNDNALLKQNFEQKFIRHFYTREIGFETFGLFQLRLKQKFDVIMPYYRELYNSILPYDILTQLEDTTTETTNGQYSKSGQFTTDLKNTGTQGFSGSNTGTVAVEGSNTGTVTDSGTNTGTVTDSGNNTGTQRNISTTEDKLRYLDTPQGDINLLSDGGGGGVADTSAYLTNAHWDTHNSDSTRTDNLSNSNTRTDNLSSSNTRTDNLANSSTTTNNLSNSSMRTDNLEAKTTGSNSDSGSDSSSKTTNYVGTHGKTKTELIQEYRNAIINIDKSIFNECNDLFMLIY